MHLVLLSFPKLILVHPQRIFVHCFAPCQHNTCLTFTSGNQLGSRSSQAVPAGIWHLGKTGRLVTHRMHNSNASNFTQLHCAVLVNKCVALQTMLSLRRQPFGYLALQWADFSDWEGFTILDFGSGVVYPDLPLLGKKREISMSCILSCIQDRWQGDLQGFKLDQRLLHFISLNIWWICSKFLGRSILPGCWSWPAVLIWEVKDLLERFDRWWMVLTGKKATP